ncbi:MAG: VTC domain-containing protein [Phycisphaerales bacterium JB038]
MDRTLTSRFECKYLIPPGLVPALRTSLRPYVRPDEYAARSEDHSYWISSLYLDSPDLCLARTTMEGHKSKFKLRILYYSDRVGEPVFCEIKRRNNQVVKKRRAAVSRSAAAAFLAGRALNGGRGDASFREFVDLSFRCNARPVIRVKYRREAYESASGEPVRITFDTRLCHLLTTDGNLSLNGGGWREHDPGGVIFEIKFTGNYPRWVRELIRRFGLQKQSIPKYVMSVLQARPGGALSRPEPIIVSRGARLLKGVF